jgi:nucleotide-binding universal stress UspA family protein
LRADSLDVAEHTFDAVAMPETMPETDDTIAEKTWGVGVELSEDHAGALRFAACLAGGNDTIVGVHVLPDLQRIHPLISREQAKAMREQIAADVTLLLERAGAENQKRIVAVENDKPEVALIEVSEREQFDALILGRRARRDDEPLIRLGEICRRVVRKLPAPVIVVSPDFGEGDSGVDAGPVVLATDLERGAASAEFAKLLAARLGRPLLIAHGIEAFNWGVSYIPAETFETMLEQARTKASARLHAWVAALGLVGAEEVVFMGDPARNLAQLVEDRRAAALVTGSRQLGQVERIFLASISSELAASARCPVAIVGD